jgi:membrane associated rhomboid family serine protease
MFLPLKDHNPTDRTPVVTLALIVVNAAIFFVEISQGAAMGEFIARWGATPYELTHFEDLVGRLRGTQLVHVEGPSFLPVTALTSMFLHGGWLHLILNMHFLWIFGNNVEDFLGPVRFLLFYLATGLLGLAAHVITDPSSPIPTVGASGAISGVMGAYLVLYPKARVTSLLFLGFFIQFVRVPAVFLITVWIVMQILGGLAGLGVQGGGIAFWAHIGGFVAGWLGVRWIARGELASHQRRARWRQEPPSPVSDFFDPFGRGR